MDIFIKITIKFKFMFSFIFGMEYDRFSWLDLSNYNIVNLCIDVFNVFFLICIPIG